MTVRGVGRLVAALAVLAGGAPRGARAALSFVEFQRDAVSGVKGLTGIRAVAVSPDGAYVYGAAIGDDAVAVFRRDPGTGALTFVERQRDGENGVDGLNRARGVTVSPDGAHVYVASTGDNAVAVFARSTSTGRLTFVEVLLDGHGGVSGLAGAYGIAVSPDGAHVYVASDGANSVAVFSRNAVSGRLGFVERQHDGTNGVFGLSGARAVAVSPDGADVYVTGSGDDAVVVFRRDATTGALTFVEQQKDGVGAVDALDGAAGVATSPDGVHVYVAAERDDAVTVFTREPATGALTLGSVVREGTAGVTGLDGVQGVVVSADGTHVYTAAGNDDALSLFDRDPTSGALAPVQVLVDGKRGVDGLNGAVAVAASPDGTSVYVASPGDDAIAVFGTRCGDGQKDPAERCDDGNLADGDGCSAECRRECAAAAQCDDANVCTDDRCETGGCENPRCGFDGARCELRESVPLFLGTSECVPIGPGLRRAMRARLVAARRLVQQAERQSRRQSAKLKARTVRRTVNRVDALVKQLDTRAARLATQQRVTAGCAAAVGQALDRLKDRLHQMLLQRGLCA
jgi:cysteine-rich repeat protein